VGGQTKKGQDALHTIHILTYEFLARVGVCSPL